MNELGYRPNICLIIINKNRDILLGERVDEDNHWQLPQGGVEENDSLEETVFREAKEELGINRNNLKILKQLKAINIYDWNDPPEFAIGKWKGQSQRFFLVEFLGSDKDIILDSHVPEFKSFMWCRMYEVLDKVHPIRKNGVKDAINEVIDYLENNP